MPRIWHDFLFVTVKNYFIAKQEKLFCKYQQSIDLIANYVPKKNKKIFGIKDKILYICNVLLFITVCSEIKAPLYAVFFLFVY